MRYFVDTPTEAESVCRSNALRLFGFADSVTLFARLTNMSGNRKLEAILVKMAAGQPPSEVTTHAGEAFLYVLSGQVSLTLEGATFVLHAGNSARYESTVSHGCVNAPHEEFMMIWVGTPRLF